MKLNYWMVAAGVLYLGATIQEVLYGSKTLAGVYFCYAISGFLLATV